MCSFSQRGLSQLPWVLSGVVVSVVSVVCCCGSCCDWLYVENLVLFKVQFAAAIRFAISQECHYCFVFPQTGTSAQCDFWSLASFSGKDGAAAAPDGEEAPAEEFQTLRPKPYINHIPSVYTKSFAECSMAQEGFRWVSSLLMWEHGVVPIKHSRNAGRRRPSIYF